MRSLPSSPFSEPAAVARTLRGFLLAVSALAGPVLAQAQVPDIDQSFYIPQIGPVETPTEGINATRQFRACPNNDGGGSLPLSARIKVVLRDASGIPISGVGADEIYLLLNGGTPAQGFTGEGTDSIVANSTYNPSPACPDVRMIPADVPTDVDGVTYITFSGSTPGSPGVATRDPNRKWGHFDSNIPVYARGVVLSGKLTATSVLGSYVLRIKNFDCSEGLGTFLNEGEAVTTADVMCVLGNMGRSSMLSYWVDFDGSGTVNSQDLNLSLAHFHHDCDTPNNP